MSLFCRQARGQLLYCLFLMTTACWPAVTPHSRTWPEKLEKDKKSSLLNTTTCVSLLSLSVDLVMDSRFINDHTFLFFSCYRLMRISYYYFNTVLNYLSVFIVVLFFVIANKLAQVSEKPFNILHVQKYNTSIRYFRNTRHSSLRMIKIDLESLKVPAYTGASFSSNPEHSSQLGFIVVIAVKLGYACVPH